MRTGRCWHRSASRDRDAREQRTRRWGRHHGRSEEHTSELQSQSNLVCRLLLEKKKKKSITQERPTRITRSSSTSRTTLRSTSQPSPPLAHRRHPLQTPPLPPIQSSRIH